MRCELGLVLAAEAARNFGGNVAQDQIVGINHEPVVFDILRFGGKSFHLDLCMHPGALSIPGGELFQESLRFYL